MANFYKSETFDLTTTNLTTVVTINTSSIAIVKSVQTSSHEGASGVHVELYIRKNGAGSDVRIAKAEINDEPRFLNMAGDIINLEAGDALKMKADAANDISGQISYLMIDRSQENG